MRGVAVTAEKVRDVRDAAVWVLLVSVAGGSRLHRRMPQEGVGDSRSEGGALMAGITKKQALMSSRPFAAMFDKVSKAALIDSLWCACQLGTDESEPQIATQAARNVVVALKSRGDKVPYEIESQSENVIDSD